VRVEASRFGCLDIHAPGGSSNPTQPSNVAHIASGSTRRKTALDTNHPLYRAMYSNALGSTYQMIGELEARVYVLRRAATAETGQGAARP